MAPRIRTAPALVKTAEYRTVKALPKKADPFYHSPEWRSLMTKLYRERGRRCQDCGKSDPKMYGDHIIELGDGGAPLEASNVRIRCASCHTKKTLQVRAQRMAERF